MVIVRLLIGGQMIFLFNLLQMILVHFFFNVLNNYIIISYMHR